MNTVQPSSTRLSMLAAVALLFCGALSLALRDSDAAPRPFQLREIAPTYALIVLPETMTAYYLQYAAGTPIPEDFLRIDVETGRVVFQGLPSGENPDLTFEKGLQGLTELSGAVVRNLLREDDATLSIRTDWREGLTTTFCGCVRNDEPKEVLTDAGGIGSTGSSKTTNSASGEKTTCQVSCGTGFYSYCNN